MRRLFPLAALALALALAAGGREAPEPREATGEQAAARCPAPAASPAPSASPASAAAAAAVEPGPVDTLAGAWRVAGIDGENLDEDYGISPFRQRARGSGGSRNAPGSCASTGSKGRRSRWNRPRPPPATGAAASTAALCTIGVPPAVNRVMQALDAADTVVRTPQNGVELSGGGHSVMLFSQ